MRRVQNLQSYAIDSPAALGPAETAEVEDSPDVERLIAAGIIAEVHEPDEVDQDTDSSEPRKTARKTSKDEGK